MALVQALVALIGRSAGKLMNTLFGWATTLLFGKVPEDRQIYLSGMAFGSVAWLLVLFGVLFPKMGVFLLTFVPLPDWVGDGWIRLGMLVIAAVIPLLVGLVSLKMLDPGDRPKGGAAVNAVLKGYPYTLGLALTLVLMLLFAPFLKLRALARRWQTAHTPVIVQAEDYADVLKQIRLALEQSGWKTAPEDASWMLRVPTRVLTFFAGGAIDDMVAEKLTSLRGSALEVTLHPSDLVVSGPEADVVHVRAVLAEQLAFTKAYLTWTKEANELEDRLRTLWEQIRAADTTFDHRRVAQQLEAIEPELKRQKLSYEEWEILFREKLLVDRGLLLTVTGAAARPPEPADRVSTPRSPPLADAVPASGPRPPRRLRPGVAAALTIVTLAWAQVAGWFGRRHRGRA